ncbi:MAG TPA: glycerol-3-phosphate 1-O-acyltransferase PlsY [Candidatus Tidjanibacter gallistercoris]|nr:glycerol-3-phosphate 1-O-acyltransferase PlsY [Candidatus Tidjanibacter gallistercoris]
MTTTSAILLLLPAAYLLGSVSNAVWIGKIFYGTDVREHGSRNAGATNTMRILGRKAGIAVFALDFLKGFIAVSLAALLPYAADSPALFNMKFALTAAVVLGHIFPVFAGFRGGKGVATLAGAVLAVYPPAVLLCLATFIAVFALCRYVSLASITAGILLPVYTVFVFGQRYVPLVIFCCAVSVLLLVTHRRNIRRLLTGTEPKTYFRKRPGGTE